MLEHKISNLGLLQKIEIDFNHLLHQKGQFLNLCVVHARILLESSIPFVEYVEDKDI